MKVGESKDYVSPCLSLGDPPGQHTALDVPELKALENTLEHTHTHTCTQAHAQTPFCNFSIQRWAAWELSDTWLYESRCRVFRWPRHLDTAGASGQRLLSVHAAEGQPKDVYTVSTV